MMEILQMPCNPANCGGKRNVAVEYLVVHYTAGHNDTAENNGAYFAREQVGASAHYFVDANTVVRSVAEDQVAWHCGGAVYRHPRCRNGNSIGIEICSRYENGVYSFAPAALERAQALLRQLMERYEIPLERVLRHYDVTGKLCPAPFTGAGEEQWLRFRDALESRDALWQVPDWARPTIRKLTQRGVLLGDGTALNLSEDLTRTLVILDRLGLLNEQEEQHA